MEVEVLLSCMYEEDFSLIEKSNLRGKNVLLVNQCNVSEPFMLTEGGSYRMLKTPTRGISVSRNLAIAHAKADVCVLADNDEIFWDGFDDKISQAYTELPDADLIIFKITNIPKKLGSVTRRLRKKDLLRVCSLQITFRPSSLRGKVSFDKNLGAGSGNGASEENKFLLECYGKGLKLYYVPVEIASLRENESTWFQGYDEEFFFNRGKTTRYIYGVPFALVYGVYYLVRKRPKYKTDMSVWSAFRSLLKGICTKSINQKYK